jgi:sigma-B regulation protein RsbQ
MNFLQWKNVNLIGSGDEDLMLSHGYGCGQQMWSLVTPELGTTYRMVLFDHAGTCTSEEALYDKTK